MVFCEFKLFFLGGGVLYFPFFLFSWILRTSGDVDSFGPTMISVLGTVSFFLGILTWSRKPRKASKEVPAAAGGLPKIVPPRRNFRATYSTDAVALEQALPPVVKGAPASEAVTSSSRVEVASRSPRPEHKTTLLHCFCRACYRFWMKARGKELKQKGCGFGEMPVYLKQGQ